MGGNKVLMRLSTISRHKSTRLARSGQLEDLLSGTSIDQASIKSVKSPGGGIGRPLQGKSARKVAAWAGKIENLPTTVKVDGVQEKAVIKEFEQSFKGRCGLELI
jgi:hypothetical protein